MVLFTGIPCVFPSHWWITCRFNLPVDILSGIRDSGWAAGGPQLVFAAGEGGYAHYIDSCSICLRAFYSRSGFLKIGLRSYWILVMATAEVAWADILIQWFNLLYQHSFVWFVWQNWQMVCRRLNCNCKFMTVCLKMGHTHPNSCSFHVMYCVIQCLFLVLMATVTLV